MTPRKKPRTIESVIRRATTLALRKMVTEGNLIDQWEPGPLSSWVSPGIIRAVKRHIATLPLPKPARKRK